MLDIMSLVSMHYLRKRLHADKYHCVTIQFHRTVSMAIDSPFVYTVEAP